MCTHVHDLATQYIRIYVYTSEMNNLVEAHCYGKGMAGQFFLSKHVAVKQVEGKTF